MLACCLQNSVTDLLMDGKLVNRVNHIKLEHSRELMLHATLAVHDE